MTFSKQDKGAKRKYSFEQANEWRRETGEMIRAFREKQRLSQKELGEKMGVSQSFISHFERGLYYIDWKFLFRFSKFAGLSLEELFRVDKDNSSGNSWE